MPHLGSPPIRLPREWHTCTCRSRNYIISYGGIILDTSSFPFWSAPNHVYYTLCPPSGSGYLENKEHPCSSRKNLPLPQFLSCGDVDGITAHPPARTRILGVELDSSLPLLPYPTGPNPVQLAIKINLPSEVGIWRGRRQFTKEPLNQNTSVLSLGELPQCKPVSLE